MLQVYNLKGGPTPGYDLASAYAHGCEMCDDDTPDLDRVVALAVDTWGIDVVLEAGFILKGYDDRYMDAALRYFAMKECRHDYPIRIENWKPPIIYVSKYSHGWRPDMWCWDRALQHHIMPIPHPLYFGTVQDACEEGIAWAQDEDVEYVPQGALQ